MATLSVTVAMLSVTVATLSMKRWVDFYEKEREIGNSPTSWIL